MRKIILTALPYCFLCLIALVISIIWWPVDAGFVRLTNSWIGLLFICSLCAIFLFQEEIYHFADQHIKNIFFYSNEPLQKYKNLPDIMQDDQRFQEMISGTVMAWIEKVNLEKEEKKIHEEGFSLDIELYKKTKKDNIKWLFLFADCFLVQQSKDFLYKIYEKHYLTESIFQEMINEMNIDESESEAILGILKYLNFIKRQEEEIIITETGSAYCAYLEQTFYIK